MGRAVCVQPWPRLGMLSQASIPPIHRYLISRNSSRPYLEPPRPKPDSLTPPNGATSFDNIPVFIATIPDSSASAILQTRAMSLA